MTALNKAKAEINKEIKVYLKYTKFDDTNANFLQLAKDLIAITNKYKLTNYVSKLIKY